MLSKLVQRVVGSPEVSTIEPTELANLIEGGRVVVIDNNPRGRWAVGHVPGAVNLDPADYQRQDLGAPTDDTTIVFYCRGHACGASHYAAKRAVQMGFRDVRVMGGGIGAWQQSGRPVETGSGAHFPEDPAEDRVRTGHRFGIDE
jgi:rhodanese-related sulfurtransferase